MIVIYPRGNWGITCCVSRWSIIVVFYNAFHSFLSNHDISTLYSGFNEDWGHLVTWRASRWWCVWVAGKTSQASSRRVSLQGWWVVFCFVMLFSSFSQIDYYLSAFCCVHFDETSNTVENLLLNHDMILTLTVGVLYIFKWIFLSSSFFFILGLIQMFHWLGIWLANIFHNSNRFVK